MLIKSIVVAGLLIIGIAAYMVLQEDKKDSPQLMEESAESENELIFEPVQIEDLLPEPDPSDLQAHMIYCFAPWGQLIATFFSADQWQMVHQISEMSGQDIEELVCEIAAARYAMKSLPPNLGDFFGGEDEF